MEGFQTRSNTTVNNLYFDTQERCPVCVSKGNLVVLSVSKYKMFTVVLRQRTNEYFSPVRNSDSVFGTLTLHQLQHGLVCHICLSHDSQICLFKNLAA